MSEGVERSQIFIREREFFLPRSSFTAFRLAYCTPQEVCDYSKTILLGNVPFIWLQDHKSNLIKNLTHLTRRKISNKFNTAYKSVKSSIGRTDQFGTEDDTPKDSNFNLFKRPPRINTSAFNSNMGGDAFSGCDLTSITSGDESEDSQEGDDSRFTPNFDQNDNNSVSASNLSINSVDLKPNLESLFYKKATKKTSTSKLIGWEHDRESFFDSSDSEYLEPLTVENTQSKDVSDNNTTSGIQLSSNLMSPSAISFYSAKEYLEPITTQNGGNFKRDDKLLKILENYQEDTQLSYLDSVDSSVTGISETSNNPRVASPNLKVTFAGELSNIERRANVPDTMEFIDQPKPLKGNFMMSPEAQTSELDFMKKLKLVAAASKGKVRRNVSSLEKRFRSRSWLKSYKKGEIIKMEKMLVLIKSTDTNLTVTNFTEDEPCDTRVVERWKEYVVVIRSTGDIDEPLLIQFCDSNEISKIDEGKSDSSFRLSSTNTINFYSTVDKTIAITVPEHHYMKIFILKCRTQVSSVRWLAFLKEALGHVLDEKVHISIPDLKTSLEISIPFEDLESLINESEIKKDLLHVIYKEEGYGIKGVPTIEYLRDLIFESLQSSSLPKHKVQTWLKKNQRLGFAFRHYDRLEWIVGNNQNIFYSNWVLNLNYFLEFRQVRHYSRETRSIDGQVLHEPTPIEGFLAKLTTRGCHEKTRILKKNIYRLMYFYTADNMLFFTKYYRAIPPLPDHTVVQPNGTINDIGKLNELLNELPEVFEYNPYKLNEKGKFSWLHPGTDKKAYEYHDKIALAEMERKTHQIIKAEELIDICDIEGIRACPPESIKTIHKFAHGVSWYAANSSLITDPDIIESEFEIILISAGRIKLQAPNRATRDEWITRLTELKNYWNNRKAEDVARMQYIKRKNMKILKMDESMDTALGFISKEELADTVADSTIYPISNFAMTKCVLMYGQLYQKQKKHANFNRYFVVLCPGFIILYSMFKRSKATGVVKKSGNYKHYLTIPLSECYVYSGTSTSMDLLSRQREFDHSNPGHHEIPRVYNDGWKSCEEEHVRCFTLWFGTKRMIAGREKVGSQYENIDMSKTTSKKNSLPKNPGMIQMVRKLGVTGKSIVFMARSREEKELWVSKILTEIDRFATSDNDIRIVDR